MTDSVRLRAALGGLPSYRPGRLAAPPPGVTAYKISSNENPYPPLPSVLDAVREAASGMNRYPDMGVAALSAALAERLAVPVERVSTGPGSVGVLDQLVAATCDAGDEVVFAWRSFEAYPIVTTLAGAVPVQVPLAPGGRHDLPAMARAVTPRTRLVLVCTPNNPTGTTVGAAELEAFLDDVPDDVLVVIDEAYLEFVTAPDAPDALAVQRSRPNVAVLRTFSKAYGLAGLRVGYAVAHEPVAAALRAAALPFGVNSLAQVAAVASLAAEDELAVRVKDLVDERERVVAALRAQGWELPEQQANFVWFGLGSRTADFAA
ncbi:MAG: histidinol-phosphate transaminase, partial [Dermatophilaceae bacterium]